MGETLIVKAFIMTVCHYKPEYDEETDPEEEFSAQSKIHYDAFFQSPLIYLKNLIMTDVTLFLHEDFLSRILEAFPSLEKYAFINCGNPYVIGFIGTKNLVAVFESLCRIKRVSISNLVLALGQSDDLDSAQTKVIFENAQMIVNTKFDKRCGPLKIVDEQFGYVLKKKEDEEASIFNMQEVNGCKVIKKSYDEKEEKFVLTVEGKEDNLILNLPKEVVKSLFALLPEDQDLNRHIIDDDKWDGRTFDDE